MSSLLLQTFDLYLGDPGWSCHSVTVDFICPTGAVTNKSALFTYDSKYLLDTYYFSPKHDDRFIPVFSVPDRPDDPLSNQASEICSGEGSQFCRYEEALRLLLIVIIH